MAARAPRAIAFPAPGPATGNQTPDPGELPPILSFVPTPAYPFGTPTIQVMAGNIYRFGCDTIVVPTTERMDRAIYGPFPRKFHTNAGQNLESYNRVVHYAQAGANAAGLGGLPGASLLQPESVALRSPAFGSRNYNWVVMVNTPRVYDNGAARSGATYIGNGDVLIRGFLNALDEAIASPNNSVPAGILPFLPAAPAALGGMPAGAGMPVGGYNIVFPYFGAQGGWTHAFFSRIMMDFIHWAFFDTANPMQFTNRASVNALTVMIPRSPASERRAAANAMRAAWAAIWPGGAPPLAAPPAPPGGGPGGPGGGPGAGPGGPPGPPPGPPGPPPGPPAPPPGPPGPGGPGASSDSSSNDGDSDDNVNAGQSESPAQRDFLRSPSVKRESTASRNSGSSSSDRKSRPLSKASTFGRGVKKGPKKSRLACDKKSS